MSGTWASAWVPGDILTAAELRKGMGCVADSTLGVAAASFDLTGLPTTYAHLMVVAYLRGDAVATSTTVSVRFNNDATANYDFQHLQGNTATVATAEAFAQGSMLAAPIPAASAVANAFGEFDLSIGAYQGTVGAKQFVSKYAHKTAIASGGLQTGQVAGFWRSTAAISRITILPASGNFAAGSRVSIYVMGS